MTSPTITQVCDFFSEFAQNWQIKIVTNPHSVECLLVKNKRKVRLKWFKNTPKEFWFSMHEENRCDLDDWTEMFETEEKEALFEYLKTVSKRYLEHETRVTKKWGFLGSGQLQYRQSEKWLDLRRPN